MSSPASPDELGEAPPSAPPPVILVLALCRTQLTVCFELRFPHAVVRRRCKSVAVQEKRISWWQKAGQSINMAGVNLFLHVRGVRHLDQGTSQCCGLLLKPGSLDS